MKKLFCAATMLALMGAASADVTIDEILVNQAGPTPERTNIRVNMHNDGITLARPTAVILQARANGSDAWQTVKTWTQIPLQMQAGKRLALDYLPSINDTLPSALTQPQYQLRAIVQGAGGPMATLDSTVNPQYTMDADY